MIVSKWNSQVDRDSRSDPDTASFWPQEKVFRLDKTSLARILDESILIELVFNRTECLSRKTGWAPTEKGSEWDRTIKRFISFRSMENKRKSRTWISLSYSITSNGAPSARMESFSTCPRLRSGAATSNGKPKRSNNGGKPKKEGKNEEKNAKDGAEPFAVDWEVGKQWNRSHRARNKLARYFTELGLKTKSKDFRLIARVVDELNVSASRILIFAVIGIGVLFCFFFGWIGARLAARNNKPQPCECVCTRGVLAKRKKKESETVKLKHKI